MTAEEWIAEGERRFGKDRQAWFFVCPSCGHVASVMDWKAAGAPQGAVAFSCVGRWTGATQDIGKKNGGPCNYAGGGLIGLNPVTVTDGDRVHRLFEFAEPKTHSEDLSPVGQGDQPDAD